MCYLYYVQPEIHFCDYIRAHCQKSGLGRVQDWGQTKLVEMGPVYTDAQGHRKDQMQDSQRR